MVGSKRTYQLKVLVFPLSAGEQGRKDDADLATMLIVPKKKCESLSRKANGQDSLTSLRSSTLIDLDFNAGQRANA